MSVYQATHAGRSARMADDTFAGAIRKITPWSLLIPLIVFDLSVFFVFAFALMFDIPFGTIDGPQVMVASGLIGMAVYGIYLIHRLMRSAWLSGKWWV